MWCGVVKFGIVSRNESRLINFISRNKEPLKINKKNAAPFVPKTRKQIQDYYDMQNKLSLKTILGCDTEQVPLEMLMPDKNSEMFPH